MKLHFIILSALLVHPGAALAESKCGSSTTILANDTLSTIAARCDVSEGALLNDNPGIDGSGDLRVGEKIAIVSQGGSATDQLKAVAGRVSGGLSKIAGWVGSSANDLLDKNPDLKRRVHELGADLKQAGFNGDKVKITLSPDHGSIGSGLTVAATDLPPNAPVVIGAGFPGQAYSVLSKDKAGADGKLQANLVVPAWASRDRPLTFVIAGADASWTARSGAFNVGAKP